MRCGIRVLGKIALAIAAIAVLSLLVMLLWNAVVPIVFAGVHAIDYRHALGLLVLSRILFGGFHGRGGRFRHRHWDRTAALTPEERAQFRRHGPCGGARDVGSAT